MPQIREQIAMVHLPPSKTLKYLFHVRKTNLEEALIFSRLLLFMPVRMKWRKRGIRKTTRIEGMRSI